jgi:hypothetical protein
MSVDVDAYIRELENTVIVAGLNYEIWRVYTSHDTRQKYVDTMNRYPLFFHMSIHAHSVATVTALFSLYETRKDSYNIPSLLRVLRNQKTVADATLDELDQMYNRAKPLWIKVSALRNKAFSQ